MKSSVLYFILIVLVQVGCTKENDSLLDQSIDQSEMNIIQLKDIAMKSGWNVSPKVEKGERATPLTQEEINDFRQSLDEYSLYPEIQENREVEIVPLGNRYIFMLPFSPRPVTKAYASSSMTVYATYGYCYTGRCNKFPIRVVYDLDEQGRIIYAFAGSDSFVKDCGCPYVLTQYTTAYYRCEWNTDWVYIAVWLNCSKYDSSFSDAEHFMVTGTVYINTGASNLDVQYIGKGLWKILE